MAEAIVWANRRVRITTTDVDPVMVQAARQRLARFSRAEARHADATRLPFDDESFDMVVSFLMLHHVIEWEHVVAEVARVLRPGGSLVGYDLLASRAASWLHLVDRSAHRFIQPDAFESVLQQLSLDPLSLRFSFGGRVLRFIVHKPANAIDDPAKTRVYRRSSRVARPPRASRCPSWAVIGRSGGHQGTILSADALMVFVEGTRRGPR